MDVKCGNCLEPWDFHELTTELAYVAAPELISIESAFSPDISKGPTALQDISDYWRIFWSGGVFEKMSDPTRARERLRAEGWEFGPNTCVIKRCPSCSKLGVDAKKTDYGMVAEMLGDLLGDDIDGIASELDDFEFLFGGKL